ncbi:MAG: hypothetical protein OXH60_04525 [Rhodospirillales bacterium]|nr:hypothetical protein [Rhodospirillales bacterium]
MTSPDAPENIDEVLDEVANLEEEDNRYLRGLRTLLDWYFRKYSDHSRLIASRTTMGTTTSYVTSVSLKWIHENVRFARELPVFKEHVQPETGRISINDTTIDYLQQREPDFRRQLPMVAYLAARKYHKFGPLILVAYKSWVHDKKSDNWGPDGRAVEPSLNEQPLDSRASLVDLDVAGTQYYALDGQHRLMAIKGLNDLLDGRLESKDQAGRTRPRNALVRDEVEYNVFLSQDKDRYGLEITNLDDLLNEVMGIEIIPAVQRNETYKEAVTRLRNIFVDVNETAQRPKKGEIILLSETQGFRIVARTIMIKHELFQAEKGLRVNESMPNLTERAREYTTLVTLSEIAEAYLASKPIGDTGKIFESWLTPILANRKECGYLRPDGTEINDALDKLTKYFDALKTIPSHKEMVDGKPVPDLRSRKDRDNILFWPIAQVAFAKAVASLQIEQGKNLHDLVSLLAKYEAKNCLRLTSQQAPWYGVLCDVSSNKIRRHKTSQDLATKMFTYLMGGGYPDDDDRERLRKEFFAARAIAPGEAGQNNQLMAYDPSGKLRTLEKFRLPDPWH